MEDLIEQAETAANRFVTYRFPLNIKLLTDVSWIATIHNWLKHSGQFGHLITSQHSISVDETYGYLLMLVKLDNATIQADLKRLEECYYPSCYQPIGVYGWCPKHEGGIDNAKELVANRSHVILNIIQSIEVTYQRLILEPHPPTLNILFQWKGTNVPLVLELVNPEKLI